MVHKDIDLSITEDHRLLKKEYPIEKIFRDARAGLIEDGSNEVLAFVAANQIFQEAC